MIRRLLPLATLGFLLTIATSCGGRSQGPIDGGPDDLPHAVGEHDLTLTIQGESRFYLLHVPPSAPPIDRPVVIALHGGGGNPSQFRESAGLDALSDREGFLVAYPGGTGLGRTALTWNAGPGCCGAALSRGVDDVAFLTRVIEDLVADGGVDPARVYVTGHSNGGMMAYRLAVEAGDRVAAIAPVAGAMMVADFSPARPVPVLHIHSVDDPRALYGGGLGPPFPGTDNRVDHEPVIEGILRWVDLNGCAPEPSVVEGRSGSVPLNAGQTMELLSWAPCQAGATVEHIRLTGAGHGWPGHVVGPLREQIIGPSTTLVDAAEEVWTFFRGR